MSSGDHIVHVKGLVKDFRPGFGLRRKRVLDGISFDVRRGEVFGFIGPNGAGKTTTLKILMGLIRATHGEATILGHDVRETAFREHVGFLPESPYFYDFLTGKEILRFYGRLAAAARGNRERRIEELLEWVGLSHAADLRLRNYSKGMLQRIGIAQALIHDPEVVFLDEPMSGLDPVGRKEIRDLIRRLHEEGKTIFMNTHILSDVEVICDRVAIIAQGRIVHQGEIQGFLAQQDHCFDVDVAGLAPEVAERLQAEFGAELRGQRERIEVRLREKNLDEALQAILRAGGRVRGVVPVRAELEDLFLEAIDRGASQEPAHRTQGGAS